MSCHHEDLGLEELEQVERAAVAAGLTAERAAAVTRDIRPARELAKETIVRLEPRHISGFQTLIAILETALQEARAKQWINEPRDEPQASRTES